MKHKLHDALNDRIHCRVKIYSTERMFPSSRRCSRRAVGAFGGLWPRPCPDARRGLDFGVAYRAVFGV